MKDSTYNYEFKKIKDRKTLLETRPQGTLDARKLHNSSKNNAQERVSSDAKGPQLGLDG